MEMESKPFLEVNNMEESSPPKMSKRRLIGLGLFAVCGLTLDWSAQGEYAGYIQQHQTLGGFLISYWAFSQFMVMFPLLMLLELIVVRTIFKKNVLRFDEQDGEDLFSYKSISSPVGDIDSKLPPLSRRWFSAYYYESLDSLRRKSDMTRGRCILVSMGLGAVFYISAWTWFLSLDLMPVSYNTAAYQSVTVFVFIFSIFLLRERPRIFKVVSVVVCVVGVVLLAVGSPSSEVYDKEWLGYLLCIFSAACYALYEVLFARIIGSQPLRCTFLFLGFTGVFIFVVAWPGLFIVNATGLEKVINPFDDSIVTGYLIGNGFLQIGFVSFFLFGISLTGSPLFITIGSMLTIPVTSIYDRYVTVPHVINTPESIAGMAVIGFGFVFVLLDMVVSGSEANH